MKYINTNDLKEPIDWNRKISSNKALTKKVKSIGFKVKEFGDDGIKQVNQELKICLLYTSPSPRDRQKSRMPSSA